MDAAPCAVVVSSAPPSPREPLPSFAAAIASPPPPLPASRADVLLMRDNVIADLDGVEAPEQRLPSFAAPVARAASPPPPSPPPSAPPSPKFVPVYAAAPPVVRSGRRTSRARMPATLSRIDSVAHEGEGVEGTPTGRTPTGRRMPRKSKPRFSSSSAERFT